MLFKTIEEIAANVKISATVNYDSLKPYIDMAEDLYLRQYLGTALLDAINTWYVPAVPAPNAPFQALLPKIQKPLASFLLFVATGHLDIQLGEQGFMTASSQSGNFVPASRERVNNFLSSTEEIGYSGIENMLNFLFSNATNYSSWTASDQYATLTADLIRLRADIEKETSYRCSFTDFYKKIRPVKNILRDTLFRRLMSPEFYTLLINQFNTATLSANNNLLVPHFRRAMAYLCAGKISENNKFTMIGMSALAEGLKIMNETPANYPLYMSSDAYLALESGWKNTPEDSVFVFGLK